METLFLVRVMKSHPSIVGGPISSPVVVPALSQKCWLSHAPFHQSEAGCASCQCVHAWRRRRWGRCHSGWPAAWTNGSPAAPASPSSRWRPLRAARAPNRPRSVAYLGGEGGDVQLLCYCKCLCTISKVMLTCIELRERGERQGEKNRERWGDSEDRERWREIEREECVCNSGINQDVYCWPTGTETSF